MQQAVPDLRLPVYNAPVNDHSKSQYDDQRADKKRDDRLREDLIKSLLLFSGIKRAVLIPDVLIYRRQFDLYLFCSIWDCHKIPV